MGADSVLLSEATWAVAGGTNKFRHFCHARATASVAAGLDSLPAPIAARGAEPANEGLDQ
ncbi:hypothetical protein [Streptomyces sp. NPDC097610]|uniref:hypothetical protein n=1 Tax=Streptomyces sp. NPDC097610 TaxID=3157227 RepID=UPI00331CA28E